MLTSKCATARHVATSQEPVYSYYMRTTRVLHETVNGRGETIMSDRARKKPRDRAPSARQRSPANVLATALLAACVACSQGSAPSGTPRMILIGIDGASPRVVDQLLAEGRLPNLANIAQQGVHGALRSELPLHSPRVWNTIVTGMVPEKHGIVEFSYSSRDGRHHLFSSVHRKARALWSIASAAGFTVGVVNFWNTYPLEKINGVMVSDHVLTKEIDGLLEMFKAVKMKTGAVIYPDRWNTRLSKMVRDKSNPLPAFESPFSKDKTLPRWVQRDSLQRRFEEDAALTSMTQEILKVERPDVTLVLLTGIDRVSHFLWGALEPADSYPARLVPTPEGRAGGKAALFDYYEYTDALIGVLTEGFGPQDLVMVVSDHGFEAGKAMGFLTGVHLSEDAVDGVLYAKGPGIAPGSSADDVSINDVAPTLLSWLGLPTALDMDGKIASFLTAEEIKPVGSYNGLAIEFVNPADVPSGVEAEIVDQLKALGYIDPEKK